MLNKIEMTPQRRGADTWTVSAARRSDRGEMLDVQADGTWSPSNGWGTVSKMTFRKQRAGGTVGMVVTVTGWTALPTGTLGVGTTARVTDLAGGWERTISNVAVSAFSPVDFKALSNPPAETDEDPVRGLVTYRTIVDLRGRDEIVTRLGDGERTVHAYSPGPRTEYEDRIRVLGWIVAASACTLIGAVWIRRRYSIRKRKALVEGIQARAI